MLSLPVPSLSAANAKEVLDDAGSDSSTAAARQCHAECSFAPGSIGA
jgi:hypothetical protein